jgi:hypothetical protein|tara:strand:+ start:821 stop:1276 length:456 start_codon:yes stop_codon:yes gene_type:complete
MSFSLREVFDQAKQDRFSVNVNAAPFEGRLLHGIKIVSCYRIKDNANEITILNTQKGGAFYEEISPRDYDSFKFFGWNIGVYILSMSNCISKINRLEETIKLEEIREPQRPKYIEGIVRQIEKTKKLHLILTNKYNKLNTNSHGDNKKISF